MLPAYIAEQQAQEQQTKTPPSESGNEVMIDLDTKISSPTQNSVEIASSPDNTRLYKNTFREIIADERTAEQEATPLKKY